MTYYLCGVCNKVHNSLTDPPCPIPFELMPQPPPKPVVPPPPPPVEPADWVRELRRRAADAGYSDVRVGYSSVSAVWAVGTKEPLVAYHAAGGSNVPAIWCIVHDLIGGIASGGSGGNCHSACYASDRMTDDHRAALNGGADCGWPQDAYRVVGGVFVPNDKRAEGKW